MIDQIADRITTWVGSTLSLLVHTVLFIFTFSTHWLFGWDFELILLVLTTVVSLEAIYISIFIQRAVNQQGERLQDVEEAVDEVSETLDDVEESLDEVEQSLDGVEQDLKEVEQSLDGVEQDLKDAEEDNDEQDASLETLLKELRLLRKELKEKAKPEK